MEAPLLKGVNAAAARSFEDGLKLVQLRGESMQAAADAAPSAMVSVIGLDADKVRISAANATLWIQCLNQNLQVALAPRTEATR